MVLNVLSIYILGDSILHLALESLGDNFYQKDYSIPGVECPNCRANGETTIVIRGTVCPRCRMEVD